MNRLEWSALLPVFLVVAGCAHRGAYPEVHASIETTPVASADDAADDPAIWIHPTDRRQSRIIGTNKQEGLLTYDLTGKQVQSLKVGRVNNVDLRHDVALGGRTLDLVVASNRSDQSVLLFEVDRASGLLTPLATDRFMTGFNEVYGIGLARDPISGVASVFASDKSGEVRHWRLDSGFGGEIKATLLRTIPFASQTEGIAVDEGQGVVYVGEEDVGLWSIPLDHTSDAAPTLVCGAGPGSPLTPDVEGIAIMIEPEGDGAIIVSSQGDHSYAVFERTLPHRLMGSFRISSGSEVDGAEETDGIDVTRLNLGAPFTSGLFVVQDGFNDDGHQNFKLVPWEAIEAVLPAQK